MPRATGSERRYLSEAGLNGAAVRVVEQAEKAVQRGRPVAWLALTMYLADVLRPEGARREDSRANLISIATVMAGIGDYGSGARCRPGRQVLAGVTGLCEKTIFNHWQLLQRVGLILCEEEGKLRRPEDRTEDDPSWRHRSSWQLQVNPAWVTEIRDADLLPYVELAYLALAQLAGRRVRTFTLSIGLKSLSFLKVKRGFLPKQPRTAQKLKPSSRRPKSRKEQTGASRPSPRSRSPFERLASVPAEVATTALQIVQEERLPFVRPWMVGEIAQTLLGLSDWLPADVELYVERRLTRMRQKMLVSPKNPVGYWRWLMRGAHMSAPPWQWEQSLRAERRALAAAIAERSVAGKPSAARDAAMAPGRQREAERAARQVEAALAPEGKFVHWREKQAAQRAAAKAARWAAVDWPEVVQPA